MGTLSSVLMMGTLSWLLIIVGVVVLIAAIVVKKRS